MEAIVELIITWLQTNAPGGNYAREIGTNLDMWKNGYLGLFFRFKMIGWLNWTAILLLCHFFFTIKSKERWEVALFFSVTLSIVFICLQGYMNSRYQLTLFPVMSPLIFLYGYNILKTKKGLCLVAVLFSGCLILGNIYVSCQKYRYYYESGIGKGAPGTLFPDKLIRYLNEKVPIDAVIQSKNQFLLYYYTEREIPVDRPADSDYYVLLRGDSLTNNMFDLVIEDQGYKLYKKKKRPISTSQQLASLKDRVPEFELNVDKLHVIQKTSLNNIKKYVSPLQILGKRNEFDFESDKKSIRVSLSNEQFNVRSILILGIVNKRQAPKLKIQNNDMVYLVIRMRQSKIKRKTAKIFIQDKTDYWAKETSDYKGRGWKDVLVKKRIRDGFTNLALGISWEPLNNKEWIEISSIQIFVDNNQS